MTELLIVVAAGSGSRLGRREPKALVPIAGKPLLVWTLQAMATDRFRRIVVVAPPDRVDEFSGLVGARARVVAGGATRSTSVRCGFQALAAADGDIVAVHDAARPLVTADEVEAVLRAAAETGAAIAAMPVVDTIKRVAAGRVVETLDRSQLYGAATPQAFRADVLRRAHAGGADGTDDAALVEAIGGRVVVVPGEARNTKITEQADLERARAWLAGAVVPP